MMCIYRLSNIQSFWNKNNPIIKCSDLQILNFEYPQKFLTVECMPVLLVGLEELKASLLLGLDQPYLEKYAVPARCSNFLLPDLHI